MAKSMKAVVFKGPHKIAVEDRPIPEIVDPTDVVIKVSYTALCGRGECDEIANCMYFEDIRPARLVLSWQARCTKGEGRRFLTNAQGHEFTGEITEVGASVKDFKRGDKVVAPFTASCLNCFYCNNGQTSRCEKSLLFGCGKLDGGQAEYVRVPLADGTLFLAPPEIPEETVVLMADIFPTGYFAAKNAFSQLTPAQRSETTAVVIGCGPVGLCALIAATSFNPKHIFAIDSVPSRLELAKSLGAEPLSFVTDKETLKQRILDATEGRGADVVLEVVGNSPALKMAYDVIRPWGIISSVGVHNAEIPFSGADAYNKNIRIQFGRCPVRAVFPEALELLKEKSHLLRFMADKIMPLAEAEEGYDIFNKMQVQKVIFRV